MSQNQHSVPVFLQKGWTTKDDKSGPVPYATLIPQRKIYHSGNKGPAALNYVTDQWTVFLNNQASPEIEDGFTNIDTAAAPIIEHLRTKNGQHHVTADDKRIVWNLLKSLIIREPEEVDRLKSELHNKFLSSLEKRPEFQEAALQRNSSVAEIAEDLMQRPLSNLGVSYIPDAFHSEEWASRSNGLELLCIKYKTNDVNFLLGDRPVIAMDFQNEEQHRTYMLPISRHALLMMTNTVEFAHLVQQARPSMISKMINKLQVGRAQRIIVGDIKRHTPLIEKKCNGLLELKRVPDSIQGEVSVSMTLPKL